MFIWVDFWDLWGYICKLLHKGAKVGKTAASRKLQGAMKKIKYYYNTNTLRYEKLVTPLRVKLLRVFGFISAALVTSAIIIWVYTNFFPHAADKESELKYEVMKENYATLNGKVKTLQQQMGELEKRDNQVYRSIFEATPLSDSARTKQIEAKKELDKVNLMGDDELGLALSVLSCTKPASAALAASRSSPTSDRTNKPKPCDCVLAFCNSCVLARPLATNIRSSSVKSAAVKGILRRSLYKVI